MGRLHLMILDNVFGVRDVVNSHTDMATALTRVTDERDPPEIKFECSRRPSFSLPTCEVG